jgi:ATP-dependent DNA helicase RecQ
MYASVSDFIYDTGGLALHSITFIDTEIEYNSGKVLDIGGIKENGSTFHSGNKADLIQFLYGSQYICGHNIIHHDLKYLQGLFLDKGVTNRFIDTLFLSPLLFPAKPYHALLKDDKLQSDDANNPLNDSIKARDLFFDEIAAFQRLDGLLKQIYYSLLKDKPEFRFFFSYLGYQSNEMDVKRLINTRFTTQICENANLDEIISEYPVELAYSLALISTKSRYSITPPWVLKTYPAVEQVMYLLKGKPCLAGCAYCNEALDIHKALKRFFGFDSYRTYAGAPLQELAVKAAVDNKSLLAVFPTGGGKSITFQVPALMSGENAKGLTVVISPLQSLMKDQVDNLEKAGITEAVTINGLLDPIERAKSIERVEDGSASILYISPESLRSRTIERLLLRRSVVRFVIDEAHCFSSWGQDFRVDYLYIGDFIKSLQEKKNLEDGIPVSCFTATAKRKVIEDICDYFADKLGMDLEIFNSDATRSNLHYKVFPKVNDEDKYNTLRDLIQEKDCPTIVYVSRTYRAYLLAQRLTEDGYEARPYHGKMDKQEKTENQDAFIRGDVRIMVATSAFGMGVDKKDVGMVIHYDISDSLENYVQEAGRAGRDEKITADCYVLYNDEDLSKHFALLNQTRLSLQEIQQVWKAIKDVTRLRSRVSQSALEIARKAGWDDSIAEVETRVKTAIAALEEAGYLKRGQNMPRLYANSILARNAEEAINKINASGRFDIKQKEKAVRIIRKLIASRSRKNPANEEAESRIDYISDHLGIVKEEVIQIVNLLREEGILADTKDLAAYIKKKESKNRSLGILLGYMKLERFLLSALADKGEELVFNLKELNELAIESGCEDTAPNRIKIIFNFWAIKHWIRRKTTDYSQNHIAVQCLYEKDVLADRLAKRHELAQFILGYLYEKSRDTVEGKENSRERNNEKNREKNKEEMQTSPQQEEIMVEFSVLELKTAFEARLTLLNSEAAMDDVEDALFFLSRIDALKIEGGFMVVYNAMAIERLEKDNKKRYKVEDYQKLNQFYQNKVQQIHIVGEYANKMIHDYKAALGFVNDYFQLNYASFLNKYFKGSRQEEIKRNITPAKFRQLFGELSPRQLQIIKDKESKYIVVAAGPGSGKTRLLVHKLASLFYLEDIKHEQLLMVTFSRAAATEFKKRLLKLIGNAANYIEIKTFHSYCFDLLGRVGTLEKSDSIIRETVRKIRNGEVDPGRITKAVLVVDEAQDMDADEFDLIRALMDHNDGMRVIAVGDDDQNIFGFRGASSKYMQQMITENGAVMYELVENYRSKSNLVDFANEYVKDISVRLKSTPISAVQRDNGNIRLVHYKSTNLIVPFAEDILAAEHAGTTCVITGTNEEALQVTGILVKHGANAKLIQSNDGFTLYHLLEMRYFFSELNLSDDIYMISDDVWLKAKQKLVERFRSSPHLELCLALIRAFEISNPTRRYKSDFEIFVWESRMEDFVSEKSETILVSTIHKAKGREFDNVFLLLNRFDDREDEAKRLLYVALTRTKSNLAIHYNGRLFQGIETANLTKSEDGDPYPPPTDLVMQLTHRDIWLDFFLSCQRLILRLNSGDKLHVDGTSCRNSFGQVVVRFSAHFIRQIEYMSERGYVPTTATVKYIVYWQKENPKESSKKEIRIVLPEVTFSRA